jgi:hypothetical protein
LVAAQSCLVQTGLGFLARWRSPSFLFGLRATANNQAGRGDPEV